MSKRLDLGGISVESVAVMITIEIDISNLLNDIVCDYMDINSNLDFVEFAKVNIEDYMGRYNYSSNENIELYNTFKNRFLELLKPLEVFDFAKGFDFGKSNLENERPDSCYVKDVLTMSYLQFIINDSLLLDEEKLKSILIDSYNEILSKLKIEFDIESNFNILKDVVEYRLKNDTAYSHFK